MDSSRAHCASPPAAEGSTRRKSTPSCRPSALARGPGGGLSSTNSQGVPMRAFQRACCTAMCRVSSQRVHSTMRPSTRMRPSQLEVLPLLSRRKIRSAICESSWLTSRARPQGSPSSTSSAATPSPPGPPTSSAAASRTRPRWPPAPPSRASSRGADGTGSAPAGAAAAAGAACGSRSCITSRSAKFGRKPPLAGMGARHAGQSIGLRPAMQSRQKVCPQAVSICGSRKASRQTGHARRSSAIAPAPAGRAGNSLRQGEGCS
mmetsp:Transcript_105610/g.294061  ORF Transcript_105610/g.294061 Transcript_105610/m.294061 type:complete len:262 (+) Transcript_105610:531-1316(+)